MSEAQPRLDEARLHHGHLKSFPPYVGGDDDEIEGWQAECCGCDWRGRETPHVTVAYSELVKHLNAALRVERERAERLERKLESAVVLYEAKLRALGTAAEIAQEERDELRAERDRAVEVLRLYADEEAWTMRNVDVERFGLGAGPWYFDPAGHNDVRKPWAIALAVLAEQAQEQEDEK